VTDRIAAFDWDLDSVRPMHHALAKELAAETELVCGFGSYAKAA
jgi:hypothetical protein